MSAIERQLAEVAEAAFDHDSRFDRFGPSNFWMRFLVFLNDLSLYLLRQSLPGARRAREAIPPLLRLVDELGIARPDIIAFITESALELADIPNSLPAMPWADESLPPELEQIPNMLEIDAMRYYVWLGRTLDSAGAVIELGAWMGGSTACLANGLRQNSRYRNCKLHVFDSFIWGNWMAQFATDPALPARYRAGDNFMDAFLRYCTAYLDVLEVTQCELTFDSDGSGLAPARWDRGPIGAFVVDHSDRYAANVKAWTVFAPSFVPGRTIVVFNQYGNLRAEELRRFCRDHRNELTPLHHLACSGRSFRFTGPS
jgi:hypothetical protein